MPNVKILAVGGGGSAGHHVAADTDTATGGGGAGEYNYQPSVEMIDDAYAVDIGPGGAEAGDTTGEHGNQGVETSFGKTTLAEVLAIGGGYGGGWAVSNRNGNTGGGGGGGGTNGISGGSGGIGQGGGDGGDVVPAIEGSAGGGGSGGDGSDDINGSAPGGVGTSNDISGATVTYAAGGAGADRNTNSTGATGAANTGDGGGGSGNAGGAGGAGGSGVVIVRYVTGSFESATGGTITTDGADTIHTFTADGTFAVVYLKRQSIVFF